MKEEKWIGVDLDGTLAVYDHSHHMDAHFIGPPVPEMVDRVQHWITKGIPIKIFTARCSPAFAAEVGMALGEIITMIQDWTEKHVGKRLSVTCMKDHNMIALWDDVVVPVEHNTGALDNYAFANFIRKIR